jgi:hypothetical protein
VFQYLTDVCGEASQIAIPTIKLSWQMTFRRTPSWIPRRVPGPRLVHTTARSLPFLCVRLTAAPRAALFQQFPSRGYAKLVPTPETKGISQTEYDLRRTLLVDSLPDGSVCVLVGASMKYSSDSVL